MHKANHDQLCLKLLYIFYLPFGGSTPGLSSLGWLEWILIPGMPPSFVFKLAGEICMCEQSWQSVIYWQRAELITHTLLPPLHLFHFVSNHVEHRGWITVSLHPDSPKCWRRLVSHKVPFSVQDRPNKEGGQVNSHPCEGEKRSSGTSVIKLRCMKSHKAQRSCNCVGPQQQVRRCHVSGS